MLILIFTVLLVVHTSDMLQEERWSLCLAPPLGVKLKGIITGKVKEESTHN